MARQTGRVLESKFIRGLITEATPLNFPTDACTETWDCVFNEKGEVTRRRGIDIELSDSSFSSTYLPGDATASFTWDQVGASTDLEFQVQQVGYTLYFFDVSTSTNIGANKKTFNLDLRDYAADNLDTQIRQTYCSFTQGRGKMFVANRYFAPLAVGYNADTDALEVESITLKYRDTIGLEDGEDLNWRPTSTIENLFQFGGTDSNPRHLYNLINQGWYVGNALEQWDTARTDLPSDADIVAYYRENDSDPFANGKVTGISPGNSPAPKGHFILDVGVDDRQGALTAELADILIDNVVVQKWNDLTTFNDNVVLIPQATGSVITDFDTNSANAFNGTVYFDEESSRPRKTSGANNAYIGKNLGSAFRIGLAVIVSTNPVIRGTLSLNSNNVTATVTLYGSNTSPSNSTDGEELGSIVVSPKPNAFYPETFTIPSSDWSNSYQYVWVTITATGAGTTQLSEVRFYEAITERQFPSQVNWFNGRLFYGGFTEPRLANVIFFSQVIERDEQFGLCYQVNDPTSEVLSDALDNDGGSIQITDMAEVQGIIGFQNQILILARNGVYVITGSGGGAFAATGFTTRRLTNTGTTSGQSVVIVRGLPVWWAEDGIYTVQFDANYQSTTVNTLTEENIKDFLLDIPFKNRKDIQGAYDRLDDVIYWVYNDSAEYATADRWTYNKVLCMNVKTQAFYPWTLTTSTTNPQDIVGIFYAQSANREALATIKFPIKYSTNTINFAQSYQTSYKDWEDYAADITATSADEQDYLSYLIAGYRLDGEGMRDIQTDYLHVFLERQSDASLFVQGRYMFSDNGDSGKWSTPQQAYRSTTIRGQDHLSTKRARLLIRGHGTALQFYMYSETGKPFTLYGWGQQLSTTEQA